MPEGLKVWQRDGVGYCREGRNEIAKKVEKNRKDAL